MKKTLLSIALTAIALITSVQAASVQPSSNVYSWRTNTEGTQYKNNQTSYSPHIGLEKPGRMTVGVTGTTEPKYDKIKIYCEDQYLLYTLEGEIDYRFETDCKFINAVFTSDRSVVSRGVFINIDNVSSRTEYTGKKVTWDMGTYKNNENYEKILNVPNPTRGAQYKFTISGETEAFYDFISVTDLNGKTIGNWNGKILSNSIIQTPGVKVHFQSDSSVTKSGVQINVHELK